MLKKINIHIDNIVALLILVLITLLIVASCLSLHFGGLPLLISIIFGTIFYIIFRNKLTCNLIHIEYNWGIMTRKILHITYILSLLSSIWILLCYQYTRPPVYFILVLITVITILLDIFSANKNKTEHIIVILLKIICLAISVYAGIYFRFPGYYGVDIWIHIPVTRELIQSGHIPATSILDYYPNSYYLFPVFHLSGAITQIITNLDIRSAFFASIVILMAISSIFIYLIGAKLIGPQIGLLASLVVSLYSYNILMSSAIIPMSLGYCFFVGLFYLIFYSKKPTITNNILIIILSLAIIFTHTIAALITLLSLGMRYFGFKLYHRWEHATNQHDYVTLSLIGMFAVAMLAIWLQPMPLSASFLDTQLGRLTNDIQYQSEFIFAAHTTGSNIPLIISVLDQGSYFLLLFLASIGVLAFLHPSNRNGNRTALIFILGLLLILPNLFQLISLRNVIPERWVLFSCVPLSIIAMFSLYKIASLINWRIFRIAFFLVILSSAIWMNITNSEANTDSPMVFNNTCRLGYTSSELITIKTLASIGAGYPMTDIYYSYTFPDLLTPEEYTKMTQNDKPTIILRDYYLNHPKWNIRYVTRLQKCITNNEFVVTPPVNVTQYIESENIASWPLIYSNNDVKAYSSPIEESP